jgi:serine/threonine protein kinase/Flp pilus assembly protein TadD
MGIPSEKSIFLEALEKETARERAVFLDEACAGNAPLRSAVEALLLAHYRPDNLLDEVPARGSVFHKGLAAALGRDGGTTAGTSLAERPGTIVGSYKLMEQIGEGGFGLVFVAEQLHPVRRKVALKVVKPGMDSREVSARFEAERQALALMDHPNIARVFDAGETDTGRPYFVMELVRGVPITDFCDQSQRTPRERLELFVHVCQAVQHAHQKGIIHRDLKPSNVLVTLHDGTPVVKVIDFGVAKAVGQQLTEKTIYTRFTQMIGTPLYMSPEQAEMSGLDVDTRSDIYSLGVLLYELLIGTTPFDRKRLQAAAFDEIRRIIREEEPARPSTRLTTLGPALLTVSAQRKTEARKLSAVVRGDLDWIVMKALEKDRSRRYETAAAFAGDVRRFLNEEPVEARPPSALYRFRKFARRNKVTLTTASLVALALVLGTAVSIWQAERAWSARAEADRQRKKAEDFAEGLKAANILLDSARADADEERWASAYALYTRAADLQPDHYLAWSGRGSLHVRLGLWQDAASDYAKAMELGAPANNSGWWGVPQLFLYTGDVKHYRQACAQLLQQMEKSSDSLSVLVAVRSCLAAPEPTADPAELARRVEKLLLEMPERSSGPPFFEGRPPAAPQPGPTKDGPGKQPGFPKRMAWFPRAPTLYVTGLAHYRAGKYDTSLQRLREAQTVEPGWPLPVVIYPVLAMAHHRAGQADQARQALASAEKAIDQWTVRMLQGGVGTAPFPWFDWIECLLLYREARVLITGSAPPGDPRLDTMERHALEAINQP